MLREWNLLSNAFNIGLQEWGWVAENPMTRVRKPATPAARDRRLTQDEIDRLVVASGYTDEQPPETLTARVGATMLFAIETAMRAGEIAGLIWGHVHVERRYVHLPLTKNGKPRDVPLSTRALELIERMRPLTGEHENNPVFGLSPRQIDVLFRKIKKKVGIEDLHFHDTRREALSRLAAKFDVMDLAKISGHQDLRILQNVYYAPKVDDLVSKMD
ncbi:integrase [Acidihalobacter prosperus]|uniref:Integrase n=1 Tax=Acidihalobacter prosperus TaxID=160660 RepID=A0A1A6C047_9GAMM|nr:integrase [Acidihalobacter prosperus]